MAKRKRGYSLYFNQQRGKYVGQLKCEIFGEEKRKSFYGKTKGEVDQQIRDFKRRLKAGEFKVVEEADPSETITLHELAEKIIEDQHDLNEISDSTYDRKCETLKKLAPIGNVRIKDITEDTVKKFLITQMSYSQSIINKVYQMLKGTFDEAVRKKYITEHPMVSIKKPKTKQEKVKVRALTLAEQEELLDILKTKKVLYGDQMLLSMFTGMRMGEVNALDIRDIDFKHGVITVNKTVSLNTFKVEYIRKRTKTAVGMLKEYDCIIACGDLKAEYLEILVTMSGRPLFYVHGNHDEGYSHEPQGCVCIDDRIVKFNGVRILGLGGSYRYRKGKYMYTESQMKRRILRLKPSLLWHKGFDILVTHAPARHLNDFDTLPHRGFECFNGLMDQYQPKLFLHGHIHRNYNFGIPQKSQYKNTTVINAFEYCEAEV